MNLTRAQVRQIVQSKSWTPAQRKEIRDFIYADEVNAEEGAQLLISCFSQQINGSQMTFWLNGSRNPLLYQKNRLSREIPRALLNYRDEKGLILDRMWRLGIPQQIPDYLLARLLSLLADAGGVSRIASLLVDLSRQPKKRHLASIRACLSQIQNRYRPALVKQLFRRLDLSQSLEIILGLDEKNRHTYFAEMASLLEKSVRLLSEHEVLNFVVNRSRTKTLRQAMILLSHALDKSVSLDEFSRSLLKNCPWAIGPFLKSLAKHPKFPQVAEPVILVLQERRNPDEFMDLLMTRVFNQLDWQAKNELIHFFRHSEACFAVQGKSGTHLFRQSDLFSSCVEKLSPELRKAFVDDLLESCRSPYRLYEELSYLLSLSPSKDKKRDGHAFIQEDLLPHLDDDSLFIILDSVLSDLKSKDIAQQVQGETFVQEVMCGPHLPRWTEAVKKHPRRVQLLIFLSAAVASRKHSKKTLEQLKILLSSLSTTVARAGT